MNINIETVKTTQNAKNILSRIEDCENITISSNYKQSFYSYKLCEG